LREQPPGPEGEREPRVGTVQRIERRHDVEHGEPVDARRVIEREPVRHPAPAIVPRDREPIEAQSGHERDEITCHRPLRVRCVVRRRWRLGARAVAAQVGTDDGESVGEQRSDPSPHQMRLGKAVEQQQRRSAPTPARVDRRLADVDVDRLESFEGRIAHWAEALHLSYLARHLIWGARRRA